MENASGSTEQEEFTSPTTLTVDDDGGFNLDGADLAVGRQVLRSIPTADLSFEITAIERNGSLLVIEYEPRPTLVGIGVEGQLVETYQWQVGSVRASARADLLVTDVAGLNEFTVECEGVLTPR
ncbi:MAG: hypothetical protein C4523_14380 [Myxococcales bacterium]|nr:MAG: hypothetical protein C4523_14380 [Myxococcales bacterium]